jgi:hypothetical protein
MTLEVKKELRIERQQSYNTIIIMSLFALSRHLHGDEMDEDDHDGDMHDMFSGTVGGHVIPGSMFVLAGLFFVILTLKRLWCDSKSVSDFCEHHIPERNMTILMHSGLIIMMGTMFGIFIEGCGDILFLGHSYHSFFANKQHMTLYILYFISGLVTFLESHSQLPPDSSRMAFTLAVLAEAIIWNEHSQMKMNLVDQRIHALVALTCLGASIMFTISIIRTDWIIPFMGSFLFIIWQGLWLLAAAYNIASMPHFTLEEMTSYFILEGVALGCFLLIFTVLWYRKQRQDKYDAYSPIQMPPPSSFTLDDGHDNEGMLAKWNHPPPSTTESNIVV